MEIIPLGVGSAFAKTLNNTNYLVRPEEGDPFLLDCGHTAAKALVSLGIKLPEVTSILLSHLHADHIGGLEEMGFSGAFLWPRRTVLVTPDPLLEYLWPQCLCGGMGQRLKNSDGGFFDATLETYFDVQPMGREIKATFGSIEVKGFRTPHIPGRPSYGFFMHDRGTGGKVMFTCDSKLSMRNLKNYGSKADLILHDCQLNGPDEGVHTTLRDLLGLGEEYRKKIVLTHYGDEWPQYDGKTCGMAFARQGEPLKV